MTLKPRENTSAISKGLKSSWAESNCIYCRNLDDASLKSTATGIDRQSFSRKLMATRALRCITLAAKATKELARATRPVPIKLITVSKGNSAGASAMAGTMLLKNVHTC